jgi:hypothetical protein
MRDSIPSRGRSSLAPLARKTPTQWEHVSSGGALHVEGTVNSRRKRTHRGGPGHYVRRDRRQGPEPGFSGGGAEAAKSGLGAKLGPMLVNLSSEYKEAAQRVRRPRTSSRRTRLSRRRAAPSRSMVTRPTAIRSSSRCAVSARPRSRRSDRSCQLACRSHLSTRSARSRR